MPATRSALSYDVFVAPEKPFAAPPPTVGDERRQKIFKGSAGTR